MAGVSAGETDPFFVHWWPAEEAKQQGITLILKFVRKRFHPNLSTSFLILLICGKTKNVNLQW